MSSLFGIGGGGNVGAAGGSFYPYSIDQSLRFDAASESELSRTFAAGNRRKWTFSTWMKRSELTPSGNDDYIFGTNTGAANSTFMFLNWRAGDDLIVTGQSTLWLRSDRVFRDVSGWYHIVWSLDTDNATASQRMRLYVNGTELTSFSTDNRSSLTGDQAINAAVEHNIGRHPTATGYGLGAYLAETHFIDGQTLSPSDFGETINGIWVPKAYSGSYGTNGFYLTFEGIGTATTTQGTTAQTNIGDDQSGTGNNFAVSGLDASDVVPDSPTLNWSTLNPLKVNDRVQTFAEGNLDYSSTQTSTNPACTSTFAVTSGKWYWEVYIRNDAGSNSVGIAKNPNNLEDDNYALYNSPDSYQYQTDGNKRNNSSSTSYGDAWTTGDIIGVALDLDAGAVYFYKNGTIQNSGTAAYTGLSGEFTSYSLVYQSGAQVYNFGQDDSFANNKTSGSAADSDSEGLGTFYHSVPSDYKSLCSANLPEATIGPNSAEQADDYFNTVLYTGDGTTSNAITGVGFQPDWVWIKRRNNANPHFLNDSVRGATKDLRSDDTNTETTNNQYGILKSFDSDGFTVSVGSTNGARANTSGGTFVAWNWKAGGTASSIAIDEYSSGVPSIASSVSAAPDAGFSIVSWTGTATAGTIGHGLSSAPEMIMVKNRDTVGNWHVYHKDITDAPTHVMYLNLTNANTDQPRFNDTTPTNTVFSVNDSDPVNKSGDGIIAYCFHSVEGYCKVGTFDGNSSATDGAFVYTGFSPSFVLGKANSRTGRWWMYDSARSPQMNYAIGTGTRLEANDSGTEDPDSNANAIQFLSNGFKVNSSNGEWNGSGESYIYLAFAENPFKYANAR